MSRPRLRMPIWERGRGDAATSLGPGTGTSFRIRHPFGMHVADKPAPLRRLVALAFSPAGGAA